MPKTESPDLLPAADGRPAYRADIEGLRALAVVPVILYHARLFGPGGFVGVDVFFVVSGYLITKLVAADLAGARFTLAGFYQRRIRRIFPALFAMFAASSAIACLLLLPHELKDFGKSLAASAAFVSNLYFRSEAGYFDTASSQKPLLHVWSLAVEEQFYIFWPLIALALYKKFGVKGLFAFCAALCCGSLFYSEFLVRHAPKTAFYLLPSRAWELALGALLVTPVDFGWPRRLPRCAADLASLAGIAFICIAILAYDEITPFPGIAALLPCAGAALIIAAGEGRMTLGARLLSRPPFPFVGRLSYSLYLWHWPILVFAQIYFVRELRAAEKCELLVLIAAAAFFSWRFIEEPIRKLSVSKSLARAWVGAGAAAGFAMASAGALIVRYDGFPGRVQAETGRIESVREEAKAFQSSACLVRGGALPPVEGCLLGQPAPGLSYDVILWGDSHAAQLAPALQVLGTRLGFAARQITKSGCGPLPGMHFFPQNEIRAQCPDFNKMAMQAILSHRPAIVILAGRWDAFAAGELLIAKPQAARPTLAESIDNFVASLRSTVRALADAGHHVIVVGQVPLPKGNSVDCFERILMTRRDPSECAAASASRAGMELRVGELLRSAVAGKTGVRMVYPFDRLCGDRVCPILTGQSEFAYMDDSHLSASGAKLLSAGIGAAIVSLSRQSEAAAR